MKVHVVVEVRSEVCTHRGDTPVRHGLDELEHVGGPRAGDPRDGIHLMLVYLHAYPAVAAQVDI